MPLFDRGDPSQTVAICIYVALPYRWCSFRGLTGTTITSSMSSGTSTPDEVEEVFAGDYKIRRTRQKLYVGLGETLDGRLAFVVFRRLRGGLIRVITARDMGSLMASTTARTASRSSFGTFI
jgi:hypothetical protein